MKIKASVLACVLQVYVIVGCTIYLIMKGEEDECESCLRTNEIKTRR